MGDAMSNDPLATAAPALSEAPQPVVPVAPRRLRLWPGLIIIAVQWLLIKAPPAGTFLQFMGLLWGPVLGSVALAGWWIFASRLRWLDRALGVLALVAGGFLAIMLSHGTVGWMGVMMVGLPWANTAFVAWLLVTRPLAWPIRRIGLGAAVLLAFAYVTLLRLDGVDGGFSPQLSWRWSATAEEQFLAERADVQPTNLPAASIPAAAALYLEPGDWPGFRGPNRDGRVVGVKIATDWKQRPPRQIWRHRVGPGWGSIAVVSNRLFTQEQRGEREVVVCYDASTGTEIWVHGDDTRFIDPTAVSGAGPRATPTFHEGKLYVMGASGLLNCLDARTGTVIWSRDVKTDSGAKVPIWGFSSSPLVAAGIVTVFGGADGKSVLGYRAASGELAWASGDGVLSYCSTHPARFGGVQQLLMATDRGLTSYQPETGAVLWQHDWIVTDQQIARVTQPTILSDTDVLLGTGMGVGMRRVHLSNSGGTWQTKETWTTQAIHPYFNDVVVHGGNAFGFDNIFLTCVSLDDGKSRWRARGYGAGQVLLLEDQGLLLVSGEHGEVALVEASPEKHKELGRFKALEGKTWNHPVLAHGRLFLRNGEEAACYEVQEAERTIADAR